MGKMRSRALWVMLLVISIVLTTVVCGAPVSADEEAPLTDAPQSSASGPAKRQPRGYGS
jgi:ABC-type phosphate transport system substrate-binding protein